MTKIFLKIIIANPSRFDIVISIEGATPTNQKQKPNKKMKTLSKKTITAVAKYGKEFCIWAAQENKDGNGANTISWSFPKDSRLQGRTRSADAAIDAGYELLNN